MTPETAMTNSVIEVFKRAGYTVKKIYNGGTPARVFGDRIIYKKKSEDYKGIPDLIAYNVAKKSFYFVEVKRPKGRVKPEQKEFIESFNKCIKFKAIVANDIDKLISELILKN